MPKCVTKTVQTILLLFLSGEVMAQNISLGIKLLGTSQKYKVEDTSRDLAAELVFPSEILVGKVEYIHKTSNVNLSFSLEHSLYSSHPDGTDTDWYQGNISVYSQSKTSLEKYYAFNLHYERILLEDLSIRTTLFHKYWKLNWSETRQYDYIDDIYSEFSSKSVQFTQTLNGIAFNIQYHKEIFNIPVSMSLGVQAAKHRSVDEHLVRSFYTVSQDWLYGYKGTLSSILLQNEEGALELMASYEVLSGDSDMKFYSNTDFNYMTLPASFETKQKSIRFQYKIEFNSTY
jgi:hypothetical protein